MQARSWPWPGASALERVVPELVAEGGDIKRLGQLNSALPDRQGVSQDLIAHFQEKRLLGCHQGVCRCQRCRLLQVDQCAQCGFGIQADLTMKSV